MIAEILLPRLSMAMEEGTLIEWLVEDGANVSVGTPLYVLESDKSSQEIESTAAGNLRIRVATAGDYPVGTLLAVIE